MGCKLKFQILFFVSEPFVNTPETVLAFLAYNLRRVLTIFANKNENLAVKIRA